MQKLTISLLASLALAATTFAGTEIESGKDKNPVPLATCFNDREIQVDLFGAYSVGNGPDHAGPIHDHGWGGGVGVNYFFTRNIGVGAEGLWENGEDNGAEHHTHHADDVFHNVDGSLIFRLPLDQYCLAPYAFLGGGSVLDRNDWAVGFVGVGVEYRIIPAKVGLFADGRWNYFGDRYGHDDQNNFTLRAGVRVIF